MQQGLLEQLDRLHDEDRFQEITQTVLMVDGWEERYELVTRLARAYNNLKLCEIAADLLLLMREEGQADPYWHFRLGYAYYYIGRFCEAAAALERAVELAPDRPEAWLLLARSCREAGLESRYQQAARRLERMELPAMHGDVRAFFATDGTLQPYRDGCEMQELYDEEEFTAVIAHIERCFGTCGSVFHELISPDIHVDIGVIAPTPERNFYTLVTMGMGAHWMQVPEDLRGKQLERAELIICLPPDWQIQNSDERWYWPIRWLKMLARLPEGENGWLGWGHSVPNGAPLADNTGLSGTLLIYPTGFPAESGRCVFPDGGTINFYQLLPLYDLEMAFKSYNGTAALLELFGRELSPIVDIKRGNLCAFMQGKRFALAASELEHLLDWEGPEGCFATDRIMADGCRVGYLYREKPAHGALESGWRFTAGDEDAAYMDEAKNHGVYALNTVCNYDPEIIAFLDAPYGSAFFRDGSGQIVRYAP